MKEAKTQNTKHLLQGTWAKAEKKENMKTIPTSTTWFIHMLENKSKKTNTYTHREAHNDQLLEQKKPVIQVIIEAKHANESKQRHEKDYIAVKQHKRVHIQ